MNNDSKELKDLLQSVAPESWDERVAKAMEIDDRYREVADAIEQAERAFADAEPPGRIVIASTKGWKLTDEMVENSSFKSAKDWKITDEMIDNSPFQSTKGFALGDD